jgi:hypothetical protein
VLELLLERLDVGPLTPDLEEEGERVLARPSFPSRVILHNSHLDLPLQIITENSAFRFSRKRELRKHQETEIIGPTRPC